MMGAGAANIVEVWWGGPCQAWSWQVRIRSSSPDNASPEKYLINPKISLLYLRTSIR